MARKLGRIGLVGLGAALTLGGCAGAGNQSAALGPNPATSVSPISTSPGGGSPQAVAKASSPHSLADVQTWAAPGSVSDAKPAAALAALTAHTESLLIVDPAVVASALTSVLPAAKTALAAAAPPAVATAAAAATAPHTTLTVPKAKPLDALRQGASRRILATLDIAEVSKSSPLWQASWVDAQGKLSLTAPVWLGQPDPKTPDVYPVKFWDGAWQKLIGASLDKIVADGYDGVSVQGAGAFAAFQKDHSPAATEMAALIGDLAARARKVNPAFSVLTDGGTALPAALPDAPRRDYLAAVDGVLARDVFYPGPKPTDNDLAPDADVLVALDTFQKAGKAVFVTERLTDPDKIADFLARARSKGYLPDAALAPPVAAPPADPKVADNASATK